MILVCSLSAQEEISVTKAYVSYQDSLFILQTITITNEGIEGINDTLVDYTPPAVDTVGLLEILNTQAVNEYNEKVAFLRRALTYRKINSTDSGFDALISGLGGDLDSFRIQLYANQLKGRWRYIDNAGNQREFDLIDHPSMTTRLRMDEDGGANENMNVTVNGRWAITVRMNSANVDFLWSGEDRNRPVFYLEKFWLPGTATQGGFDNSRWIKIN
jgi:hypothetical protein